MGRMQAARAAQWSHNIRSYDSWSPQKKGAHRSQLFRFDAALQKRALRKKFLSRILRAARPRNIQKRSYAQWIDRLSPTPRHESLPVTGSKRAAFLSYASQDAEAARRICAALTAAGVEVWLDQSELRGGDAWDRQIKQQIHDCALFIPIISSTTQARREGYFRREWRLAVDRTLDMSDRAPFLVPIVIDDTGDQDADVPDSFLAVQWTRLPAGDTPPAFVDRIARLLSPDQSRDSSHVGASAGPAPRPTSPHTKSVRNLQPSRPTKAAALLIAAIAAIGVGYLAIDRFWLSKPPVPRAGSPLAVPTDSPAQKPIPERSIAVLPFVDMSEKHDQEYFGDGMAEEILNLLVTIPELKVIGRTSSFRFKGKTDDLRAIGTALGATYVVEGSVRRSGDHARVTAQLIDTRDGTHRWSETYDRDARDVLKVQDDIATNLVRALQLEVTTSSHLQGKESLRNSEAYDNYLRGLHARDRYDQSGFDEAAVRFRRALDIDPSFVPAAEALALALRDLADWGFVPPKTGWEQARTAAAAALKLDPNSAAAHAVLGRIHTDFDWDWPAAAREVNTSVTLAPNNALVLYLAATERLAIGQFGEASHFLDGARAADPLDPTVYLVCGWVYLRLGRLAEAESANRRVLEISPTYVAGHYFLGIALLTEGKPEAALAEMLLETPVGGKFAGLAAVYSALHRTKEADAALARVEADDSADMALQIGEVYAVRGKKDRAFAWLDRAYAQKDINLFLFKGDPLLKTLEQDSRYKAFLHKMSLPD